MQTSLKDVEGESKVSLARYTPYLTIITPRIKKYAETRLGESEEAKYRGLKEMREMLKDETYSECIKLDEFLVKFLRNRRYNVGSSVVALKRYHSGVESNKRFFCQNNLVAVRKMLFRKLLFLLPFRDPNDRAIAVVRLESWDVNECTAEEFCFVFAVLLGCSLRLPANQVMGYVTIYDLKGLSLRQIAAITPHLAHFLKVFQTSYPCRLNSIHVVNLPSVFQLAWSVVKPWMSEKMRSRVVLHKKSGYESLHAFIPAEILPEELGGCLVSVSNSHWARDPVRMLQDFNAEIDAVLGDDSGKSRRDKRASRIHSKA